MQAHIKQPCSFRFVLRCFAVRSSQEQCSRLTNFSLTRFSCHLPELRWACILLQMPQYLLVYERVAVRYNLSNHFCILSEDICIGHGRYGHGLADSAPLLQIVIPLACYASCARSQSSSGAAISISCGSVGSFAHGGRQRAPCLHCHAASRGAPTGALTLLVLLSPRILATLQSRLPTVQTCLRRQCPNFAYEGHSRE